MLDHDGRIVKRLGDGLMATFLEPRQAVDAALDAQAAVSEIEIDGYRPKLRAGIHWGSPRKLGGDFLGVDVNIAARIVDAAKEDSVLVSDVLLTRVDTGGPQDAQDQAAEGRRSPARPAGHADLARVTRGTCSLGAEAANPPPAAFRAPPPPRWAPGQPRVTLTAFPVSSAGFEFPHCPAGLLGAPMSSPSIPYQRLAGAAFLAFLLALVVVSGPPAAHASPPSSSAASQLQRQIGSGQNQVSALSGTVSAARGKITALSGSIASLQEQINQTQRDLYAKRAVLLGLRDQADAAQARLVQLQSAERATQATLAQQLVGMYEGDAPDVVSVVLESSGFSNMLERLAFAQKVDKHDAKLMSQVQASRRAVAAQGTTLAALSVQQQKVTLDALYERNRLARARLALIQQQGAVASSRDAAATRLAGARRRVASLQAQLTSLQARATGSGGASVPVKGFTFPMLKSDVAPPATWSLDDGVDIAAPGGTPELAVCSGAIVLHGIGGFGPSAPVLHCDSPLAGYDYVYYGHAGPGPWVPVGTHVKQGQVISEVGSGIVGISTGPHLEIGFADSSGSPIGPSSAGQMMSLLRASY